MPPCGSGPATRPAHSTIRAEEPIIARARKQDPTVIADNPNWHRFRAACPFYRERWGADGEQLEGRQVLYHVICLQNTPPETLEEQEHCLEARTVCWRLRAARRVRSA
jgi:hypothetical protein